MVGIEVMLFPIYGVAGFAIAFLPVLLVAYAMRNEADAERKNSDLVRRNRELSILTESSTQILSAEDDQETLRRLTSLLSKLAKMKACAVVTWETNPDVPGTVYRFGECLPTNSTSDNEPARWPGWYISAKLVPEMPKTPAVPPPTMCPASPLASHGTP